MIYVTWGEVDLDGGGFN